MKVVSLSEMSSEKTSHGDLVKKTFIHDGEIPHINTFAQVTIEPGQTAPDHDHNGMYEVFLIEKGKVKIVFDGAKEVIAETGDCIVTEPQETHEVSNPFSETAVITYLQSKV